jgi:hypothetical protein
MLPTTSNDSAPEPSSSSERDAGRDVLARGVAAALVDRYGMLNADFTSQERQSTSDELKAALHTLWMLAQQSDFGLLSGLLPPMIRAAHRVDKDCETDFALRAEVYQLTAAVMTTIGQHEMAYVAADRAITASEQIDDVLGMAAGYFRLSIALFSKGETYTVLDAVRVAKLTMERKTFAVDDYDRVCLRGALELCRALASARLHRKEDAFASIREAYQIAMSVPPDANVAHTEFGLANVSIHEVAVFAELGMYSDALGAAKVIDTTSLSAERTHRLASYLVTVL